ncbi:acyltransferase family protein [Micrococcaceae bacterium Sec5.7]
MVEQAVAKTHLTSRSGAVDFLRILGIVAVVAGHMGAWSGPIIREGVYTWHVPLFFFLSGYLWSENRLLMAELRKRARTLLIPYGFWLALVGIWWLSQMEVIEGPAIGRLVMGGSHLAGPFAAFWFVTALFVSVVVLRAIQGVPLWLQWTLAAAALVAASLAPDVVAQVPLSALVGCACLVFVMAGREFKRIRHRVTRALSAGALILLACGAVILAGWSTYLDLKYAQLGTPVLTVLVAVGICTGLVLVAEAVIPALGTRFNAGMTTLARCGFMVVLTHAVVLVALTKLNAAPWLIFTGSLAGCWIPALLILRTPLAPFLLGSPRLNESKSPTAAAAPERV